MKNTIIPLLLFAGLATASCSSKNDKSKAVSAEDKALLEQAQTLFQVLPASAEVDYNKTTVEKFELGQVLYFDQRLSKEGNISCNSCHNLNTFGVDNKQFSEGDDGGLGNRNSPTVLNAALHFAQFWDGRAKDVEEQAGMPILNPVEMAIPHEDFLVDRLKDIPLYQDLFQAAFPEQDDPISYENLQLAIGAFERVLLTPAAWDDYLEGDQTALTKEQKEGLRLFINTGCTTCHSGSLVGGNMYQKFGIHSNYWEETGSERIDSGRISVTGKASDLYNFKVASLRNITKTSPYFHDGSIAELGKAITIMASTELGKTLTAEESAQIASFLDALTAEVPESLRTAPEVLQEVTVR